MIQVHGVLFGVTAHLVGRLQAYGHSQYHIHIQIRGCNVSIIQKLVYDQIDNHQLLLHSIVSNRDFMPDMLTQTYSSARGSYQYRHRFAHVCGKRLWVFVLATLEAHYLVTRRTATPCPHDLTLTCVRRCQRLDCGVFVTMGTYRSRSRLVLNPQLQPPTGPVRLPQRP